MNIVNRKIFSILLAILILSLNLQQLVFWKDKIYARYILTGENYNAMKSIGNWLKNNTPEDTTFMCADLGILSYYSKRRTVDFFGLTDTFIAHQPGNHYGRSSPEICNYIIHGRKPDYLILVSKQKPETGIFAGNYSIDHELFNHGDFSSHYSICPTVPSDIYSFYFTSRDYYYLLLFKRNVPG